MRTRARTLAPVRCYAYDSKLAMGNSRNLAVSLARRACHSAVLSYGQTWVKNPGGSESISDNEDGYEQMNACDHVKDVTSPSNELGGIWVSYPEQGSPPYTSFRCVYTGGAYMPLDASTPPDISISDEMRRRAWQGIYPTLQDGFSLAQFIAEARDLLDIIATIRRVRTRSRQLSGVISPSDASKSLAELILMYSFGIAPLLSDLNSIRDRWGKTRKIYDKFVQQGKKVSPYHYTENIPCSGVETTYATYVRVLHEHKATFHATAWLSYNYEGRYDFDAWSRVWGLRINPKLIWDLIPFSFVVDWVLGISDFLDQCDNDPRIQVQIHAYCESLKLESEARTQWWIDPDSYKQPGYEVGAEGSAGTCRKTSYRRYVGQPSIGMALPHWDSLSRRELVLAGALARVLL